MSTTMTLGKQLKRRDRRGDAQGLRVSEPGYRLLDAIRRSLFAILPTGVGGRAAPPLISPVVDREIAAIDNFAHFLSTHTDMPAEHRDRFLRRILRSCEEIRKKAS